VGASELAVVLDFVKPQRPRRRLLGF